MARISLPLNIRNWIIGLTEAEIHEKHKDSHDALHRRYHAGIWASDYGDIYEAAEAANETGRTLHIDWGETGTYALTEPLILTTHVTSDPAVQLIGSGNTCVQLGTPAARLNRKRIVLPTIRRTGSGWMADLTPTEDIGLRVVNANGCLIEFGEIFKFGVGLSLEGRNPANGCASNTIRGCALVNNANNLVADNDSGGWVSQTHVHINQFLMSDASFTPSLTGTCLIDIRNWVGSWHIYGNGEGDVPEYKVKLNCIDSMIDLRMEVSQNGTARAHFGAQAAGNVLRGHMVEDLTVTTDYEGTQNTLEYYGHDGGRTEIKV